MDRKLLWPLTALMLAALACSLGTQAPEADGDEMADAVAATLTAAASGDGQVGSDQISPQPDSSPQDSQAAQAVFKLAYAIDGDVWLIEGDNAPVQLTSGGDVTRVWLSDDGQRVLYLRRQSPEGLVTLEAVDSDGGAPAVLLTQSDLDAFYPLNESEHHRTWQIDFIPGTHEILFNTQVAFLGPGLVTNDDLYRLDTYTGELTEIIPPGNGGDFTISPDGTRLAISTSTSIGLANIDGSDLQMDLITFDRVSTYSEYSYYPQPAWAPDSSSFGLAIPSEDPLAPNPTGAIWIVTIDGIANELMTVSGNYLFPQVHGEAMISSSHDLVTAVRDTPVQNVQQLDIVNLNDANETHYDQGAIHWYGWSPDGVHFAYALNGSDLKIGRLGQPPLDLARGISFRWIAEDEYIFVAGQTGAWSIFHGVLGASPILVVSPAGNAVPFDVIPGN